MLPEDGWQMAGEDGSHHTFPTCNSQGSSCSSLRTAKRETSQLAYIRKANWSFPTYLCVAFINASVSSGTGDGVCRIKWQGLQFVDSAFISKKGHGEALNKREVLSEVCE